MKKVEWNIPAQVWQGLNSRYPVDSNLFGPDEFAAGSLNFVTSDVGSVVKRPGTTTYNGTPLAAAIRDQYEMVFRSGARHELVMSNGSLYYSTGNGIFTSASSGYTATANMEFTSYQDKAYFSNGIDAPKVYDMTTSYGGVTYTPPQVKTQGAQVPGSAPTVGTPTSGGSVPAGVHTYKVTYLYYGSEESNGSTSSGTVTISTNHTVPLTAIPVGGYGVTARKIYRDDNDGVYVLVGTIDNNTGTTFNDTSALGTTPIPTDNNVPPFWTYGVTHRDRIWMGGISTDQSKLYYTEAGFPDVVFTNNFISCSQKDSISGLAVYNDRVFVWNKGSFGMIQGTTSRDFRYIELSPNIGCADNRSIQTITVKGVPKLQWLSNIGIYQYDGSNLQPVSDKIDNLLKFNIQQALSTAGRNTQNTQADFLAGTSSAGITLTANPGVITNKGYSTTTNPTKNWDTEAEWESGISIDNCATDGGTNTIGSVTRFRTSIGSGTNNGTVESSFDHVTLPVISDFTGESVGGSGYNDGRLNIPAAVNRVTSVGVRIIPSRSGTITSVNIPYIVSYHHASIFTSTIYVRHSLYTDSAGAPGSEIAGTSNGFNIPGSPASQDVTLGNTAVSFPITAGTPYWIVVEQGSGTPANCIFSIQKMNVGTSGWSGGGTSFARRQSTGSCPDGGLTVWQPVEKSTANGAIGCAAGSYVVSAASLASSGVWVSSTYDSKSSNAVAATLINSGTYPSGTSSITTIEAAADPSFLTSYTSQAFNNVNGTVSVTLEDRRYWRIRMQLNTTDSRVTPNLTNPILTFQTFADWFSEVIDHTANISTLDALTVTATVPAGTTVTATIATSDDNVSYSSYTVIGSAVPKRYSIVKLHFDTDSNNIDTAVVTSLRLDWSVIATFISSTITTATTPAGWSFFQTAESVNGGTLAYYIRSNATEGGLAGESWTAVANGDIIPVTPRLWVQWKVVITSHADSVPEVNSVTINWYKTLVSGIRVASMFYDKCYYLAAAEFNSATNNIVLRYDEFGNWNRFSALTINTMGLFFNTPYYGDATSGTLFQWLDPNVLTDDGDDITMTAITKSYELEDMSKTQWPMGLVASFKGTGARLTPTYSVDDGSTFLPMVDIVTGLEYFDTPNDGLKYVVRFVPVGSQLRSGYGIMFKLENDDEFAVEIYGLRAQATVSNRPVLTR